MKRWIALILALCCLLPLCVGCGQTKKTDKIEILCTVFPLYDWVRNIVGDSERIEVSLLITNGSDLHSYQPSAEDMIQIASCDLFFFVGGVSDAWVEETLEAHPSPSRVAVKMTELPDIRLREICEDSTESHHDHGHGAMDEHLWLSLWNACVAVDALCEQICLLDEAGAEQYRENCENYTAELDALDQEYASFLGAEDAPILLCADRFPFVYLAEDYGLRYIAAFEGCSTDANATPETVLRLAKALDEHRISAIFVTERSDGQLAESVRDASTQKDQEILRLDSMQSVTEAEADGGADYLSIMKKNLETLRQALAS